MWNERERGRFNAAIWKGPTDVTTATVRLAMLLGVGFLWLGLILWIYFLV